MSNLVAQGGALSPNTEWLGSVPDDWDVVPLKALGVGHGALFIDGDWIESKDLSDDGIRYITTGNVGEGVYKEQGSGFINEQTFQKLRCTLVLPGDVLISRLNLPIARACIAPDLGCQVVTSVDNVILRPKNGYNCRFLVYLMSSAAHFFNTENLARGATMKRISRSALGNIRFAVPQFAVQTELSSFLDRETARIDAIIEKKTRFIELLKEKRQALITQAVTKGLDPNVPMRDSGVEWIGEVPEGWTVSKLKRLGRLKGGAGFPPAMQGQTGMEIGFYKVGDLGRSSDGITLSSAQHTISREMASKIGARIFAPGSLCWAKIGAALSLNRRRLISTNACLDNNMTGFTCDERVASSRYMLHLMSVVDFSVHAKPGAVPSFSEGDQGELPMPVPPIEEQMEIAEYIDRTESKMHTLMMRVENSIDLLKERRSALITAAVTGQIDLREAA